MSADLEDRAFVPDSPPRLPRSLVAALVLVPVVAFTFLLWTGLGRDPGALPDELVGEPAPAVELPLLDGGGSIDLGSFDGQVLVVNFWASWCRPCREEHPALLEAWGTYRDRGVVLVGVDFEDTREGALAYAEELGGDWPLAADPGARAAIAFGVFGVPETFVIGTDGTIVARTVGAVSYDWLAEHVDAALRSEDAR
ncbi:MAG: TlpA family protein disulfide reductase [Actinomycetota bacterium]